MLPTKLRWTRGNPPPVSGLYLIQRTCGDVVVGEVYLDMPVEEGPKYWAYIEDDSSINLDHPDLTWVARHYGPLRRPPRLVRTLI